MAFSVKGTVSLLGHNPTDEATQTRLDEWLAMIEGLNERQLTAAAVVLDASDAGADCLRRLYRLLPALASPGPALAQAMESKPLHEWLLYAYQLAVVRGVLAGVVQNTTEFEKFARAVADEAELAELANTPTDKLKN